MNANVRAIVFDLDGTLVDSLEDLAVAMNDVLREAGQPEHPIDAYRHFIGWGAADLVRRAAPDGDHAALLEGFRRRYHREGLDRPRLTPRTSDEGASRPYDGIPELLRELVARRVPLAVLSNKPHPATVAVVARFFPEIPFVAVVGARDGVPHKPDPTAALEIAEALGVPGSACAFVGDTEVDVQTALNARMTPIGVAWGFRAASLADAGAVRVIAEPRELLDVIG
ncbi:MAG: HAD family hydrolase [Myxococcota bacterium]|nr:HAD family hydrolase [Myxococcota bacterium]